MGHSPEIKGKSYQFCIRNESNNDQRLQGVDIMLSATRDWGSVGANAVALATIALEAGEDKVVTINIPIINGVNDGWTDSSVLNLIVRQTKMTVGLNNDNAIRFYLVENQTESRAFEGPYVSLKQESAEETLQSTKDYNQQITCWGDSLTAQGRWTYRLQQLSGITVNIAGTGGENARTIMARQGGDVMIVNDITIPAGVEPVTVASASSGNFNTALGYTNVGPLRQGGTNHVNPCYIGDIQGTLTWTGASYDDNTGVYTFTRSIAGDETVIDRPTALRTAYDVNHNNDITIIFMGQNGGYTDNDDLVNMHRLMIDHMNSPDKQYVVLGLSSGSATSRADYETAMKKAFGRRFISLREYLSQYGLDDAGITPTEADTAAMAMGTVPPSLLTDTVHFNDACTTVIGNMLYKKMVELNIL